MKKPTHILALTQDQQAAIEAEIPTGSRDCYLVVWFRDENKSWLQCGCAIIDDAERSKLRAAIKRACRVVRSVEKRKCDQSKEMAGHSDS